MVHRMFTRFHNIPPWLFLVILGIITFFAHPISIPSDLKLYFCNALNIYLGKGYVDIDGSLVFSRAPLFSIMISFAFWLFGVSHESVFRIIKTFCILNPILVYVIGQKFFGKRVGVSAALLVLTSYAINYMSFRHLDAVWPFFVLLSVFSFYLGFEANKSRYFVLGGISIALAYLVKEVALLFFPLPILMFLLIPEYRKKTFLPKVIFSILVTFIVILPWFLYLIQHNQPFGINLVVANAGSGFVKKIADSSGLSEKQNFFPTLLSNLKAWCMGLWHYYHVSRYSMGQWFTLSPLFLIAWCFVIIGAFRGDRHQRILVFLLILFSPIIYFQGARHMRIGQTLIVFLLSYLVLAVFIDSVLNRVSQRVSMLGSIMPKIFVATIACLILLQHFMSYRNDLGNKAFIKKSLWFQAIFGSKNVAQDSEELSIADNKAFLDTIEKFSTPPNKLFMAVTNRSIAKEIYFNLKGKNTIYYLQKESLKKYKGGKQTYLDEQPIYLYVSQKTGPRPHQLGLVNKSNLIETIRKEEITHVLVETFNNETGGNRGLDRYFSTWPAFKRMSLPFEEINVYQFISNTTAPPSLPPIIEIESLRKLKVIGSEKIEKNMMFLKLCYEVLYPSTSCIRQGKETPDESSSKASSLNKAGMNRLLERDFEGAVELFKQAVCVDTDDTEAYDNLFYINALLERQKAIALNPENPIAYFHYAIFLEAYGYDDTALFNVQKAVSLDPNYTKAYTLLGFLYLKMNENEKAIEAFQQAVNMYKKFIVSPLKEGIICTNYVMMGDAYFRLENLSKAKAFYERAVLTNSKSNSKIEAYLKLGVVYNMLKDYQSAIENLQQAVRLNPNFSEAYYYICKIHLTLGDRKTAVRQYKKIRKIDPLLADKLNQESGWTLE